jgi:hypothetical protein
LDQIDIIHVIDSVEWRRYHVYIYNAQGGNLISIPCDLLIVNQLVRNEVDNGTPADRIVLGGFSQGN